MLLRFRNDIVRNYAAFGASALVTLAIVGIAVATGRLTLQGSDEVAGLTTQVVAIYLVFWIISCTAQVALTHLVCTRLPEEALRDEARRVRQGLRPWERWLGAMGPVWASSLTSMVAVALALLLARLQRVTDSTSLMLLGTASVVAAWAIVVQSFAVEYHRMWLVGDPMRFEHDDRPEFDDFVTTSIHIATLLSCDVRFGARRARRIVRTQGMLALLFNTVVLAMVVSIILS
ncbi:MAG: DUF1345 domain-containing protein [Propionibacteriaceae bacterium]|nr:DUF1345 domain-containing protein [Propionibacteriaceae bacterium]